ncbi:hypothetical protein TSACC_3485 [Terrimicrobium sacchariphilum]|uniref:DUF3592 domain-containing protein n=1 Tax=Terrimicrobium sacchariphilum TaxID=690879 RepID=A0A146GDN2_TERSA|nr:hypothetical protein [Terrimicrobium sacchariphilum]GAT35420.1 hypothetical protein TSACC_3485 [Terrimicrobium sacchariphilum]
MSSPHAIETYTPGCVAQKMTLLIVSLLILAFGLSQLGAPLRLLLFGHRSEAEAISVTRTKVGMPDLVMHSDNEIVANQAPHDRSYVYWNDFVIHTEAGERIPVRANVGSRISPLFPLRNADGLPTTVIVCYNPENPRRIIFPTLIGTWLVPSLLALGGLAGAVVASFLLYWARRPIELPHISAPSEPTGQK